MLLVLQVRWLANYVHQFVMYYSSERLDFSSKNKLFMCIFLRDEFINSFLTSKMVSSASKAKKRCLQLNLWRMGLKRSEARDF